MRRRCLAFHLTHSDLRYSTPKSRPCWLGSSTRSPLSKPSTMPGLWLLWQRWPRSLSYRGYEAGQSLGKCKLSLKAGVGACPLLALSRHADGATQCPLSGEKRTCLFALQMSAYDPKRTSDTRSRTCANHSKHRCGAQGDFQAKFAH